MAAERSEIQPHPVRLPSTEPYHAWPHTPEGFIEAMEHLAHNWRYSDDLIGKAVRHWVGRGGHDGTVRPGLLAAHQEAVSGSNEADS